MRYRISLIIFLLACLSLADGRAPVHAGEIQPTFLLDQEPAEKPDPRNYFMQPELLTLWRQVLSRPESESEIRRQVAEAIVTARQMGHKEPLAAIPELKQLLSAENVHPGAVYSAARALIVLDDRSSAGTLFEVSQKGGKDLRQLVEPALAEWGFEGIRPTWKARIASVTTPRRDLILAIQGLARQRDATAVDALLLLAMNADHPAEIRLAAARAVGQITDQGQATNARTLVSRRGSPLIDRLCAVSLIVRHPSEAAVALHQSLGTDPEPAVAGEALRSLFSFDPKLVLPLAEGALKSADANVRRVGIQTYVTLPTPERIQTLSLRLNDPHPELRGLVRESFFALSKNPDLEPTIRSSTIAILGGDDWRGQEQGALLLGALDEESVANRLLTLLDSDRAEVKVATAWSLKSLEIPATAEPVLAFARRRTDSTEVVTLPQDRQLAHLFELLGKLKMAEAIPVMEAYIPKGPRYGITSRSAAVWAIGKILDGKVDEKLADQIMDRVMDFMSSPPEAFEVRRAGVLSLGHMKAQSQLKGLRKLIGDEVDNDLMELTLRWAVLKISGEALPIAPPLTLARSGWFLEPTPRAKAE